MKKQKRAILFVRIEERSLAADPFLLDYRYKTLKQYCREHQFAISHAFYAVGASEHFEKTVLPGIKTGVLQADIILVNYFHELAIGIRQAYINETLSAAHIQIKTIYQE